jgi:hypothetical protein
MDEYRANYKRMPDGQLLELAEQVDELTEEAQTALRAELGRRGIAEEGIEEQKAEAPPNNAPAEPGLPEWFLGSKAPPLPDSEFVAVFSAQDESEADQVQESLRIAGIENQAQIVILVPQAQAEKAFDILSEHLGPDAEDEEDEEHEDTDKDA